MLESKYGASTFHQTLALFTRDSNGELLSVFGTCGKEFKAGWDSHWKDAVMKKANSTQRIVSGKVEVTTITVDFDKTILDLSAMSNQDASTAAVEIFETKLPNENQYRGLVKLPRYGPSDQEEICNWLVNLVLQTSRLSASATPSVKDEKAVYMAREITTTFSDTMRNIANGDQWDMGGRDFFEDRIYWHTSRQARVEFILPAFPCKSTSLDKVAGTSPDKGEELALQGLFDFVKDIETLYEPGARVLIVSDGHVFSDCIGADDEVVDKYAAELIAMKDQLFGEESHKVEFVSLPDVFLLDDEDLKPPADAHVEFTNFLDTNHTAEADTCRKFLIAGTGIDSAPLREKIQGGDKAAVSLYRGFSRFMFEDLSFNPVMSGMSKNKRKALSSKIAFEMIKRNQAYSNLVDLLFPAHVRLSIHAHINSGPKFGVNLLARFNCKTTASLLDWTPEKSDDLLHVPTPWHNTMVKIHGTSGHLLVKASLITEAVEEGQYKQEWCSDDGPGGYYLLRSTATKPALKIVCQCEPAPGNLTRRGTFTPLTGKGVVKSYTYSVATPCSSTKPVIPEQMILRRRTTLAPVQEKQEAKSYAPHKLIGHAGRGLWKLLVQGSQYISSDKKT